MKVMIVVLVAIAVAAVLVLFYGAVRPEGDPDADGGVEGGLGWLAPSTVLDFDDVAQAAAEVGADCVDAATRSIVVPANGVCGIPLDEPAQLRLCPAEGIDVQVIVDGSEYPEQELDASDLACAPPGDPVRIYDADSVLTIRCLALTTCALAVVGEGD